MRTYIFGAFWLICSVALPAQTPAGTEPRVPSVTASGDAVVSAAPDLAKIEIGVLSQASTAQAAAANNAAQLKSVLERLRSILGPKAEIQTAGYSLTPNYQYPRPGGQPTVTGYSAANTVQVSTEDLAGVGKLIDAATQAGATNIRQLQFTLKDEAVPRAEALRRATQAARGNAQAMANALGMKLGRVVSVSQGSQGPVPIARTMMMAEMAAAPSTPIEEGKIEVRASVTLTIALE